MLIMNYSNYQEKKLPIERKRQSFFKSFPSCSFMIPLKVVKRTITINPIKPTAAIESQ